MEKFKLSFMSVFLYSCSFVLVLFVILALIPDIFLDPEEVLSIAALKAFLITLPFAIVALALLTLILISYYSITLDSEGILSSNTWGIKKHYKWSLIRSCKPINILGLRYVLVYAEGEKWAMWIPEFLSNKKMFYERAKQIVPSTNAFMEVIERFAP